MDAGIPMTCNNQNLMPKLRKNRRIESRWGVKYHTAVKDAVFGAHSSPYKPLELPPSLKEYSDADTLYMCTQCKDCFRFESSFEDHTTRHSWILGYWCQPCFVTICTHMSTEGSPCSVCLKLDRDKRSYLRGRGLHKSQKFGAIRVFYNQCQFFAHLKTHNVTLVDMGDLMLLPLPTSIGNDWCPELDIACEALMEHAFTLRTHIMEWLKAKKVESNWWQLAINKSESNDDPVSEIVKSYKGRLFFKPVVSTIREKFSTSTTSCSTSNKSRMSLDITVTEPVGNIDKSNTSSCSDTVTSTSDQSFIENEDNPCTLNDITFVDCGPASKYFEPEAPVNNISRKHTTIFVKSSSDSSSPFQPANIVKLNNKSKRLKPILPNCTSSDVAMAYGNTIITPKLDIKDSAACLTDKQLREDTMHRYNKGKTPIKIIPKSNISKVDADTKTNKVPDSLHEPLPTVHSDTSSHATKMEVWKNKLDTLKQTVNTMPVNPGKKVLTFQSPMNVNLSKIITQLPTHLVNNKKIVLIGQESDGTANSKQESPKKFLKLVPDASLGKGMKTLQTKTVPLRISGDLSKTQQLSFPRKLVCQNGRKYIVRHTASVVKNTTTPNLVIPTKDMQSSKQATPDIPSLIPLNSSESESTSTSEKVTTFHSDISPPTPSPSPSELSSSSSCDVQSKQPPIAIKNIQKPDPHISQLNVEAVDAGVDLPKDSFESLSFHKGEDEKLYLDIKFFNQKPAHTIADTCTMITKCKQEMLNEFFHLSHSELKKRYEHLQHVHDEISSITNVIADNVIKENLKAVNILKHVLKHCIDKCNDKSEDTNGNDAPLNEWESEYESSKEKLLCRLCNKIKKPKSYIPGFSKPAKNDKYCSCYRHVCHKCFTYQGNPTRFIAHRNVHNKEKPYLCPDCYRRFSVFKSLEIHNWTVCFHTLKKRVLGCKICEINGFQDMESITRHFAIMHSHSKIACDTCSIVLPSYVEYKKHTKEIHSVTDGHKPVRIVLCKLGRCIVRYEDYMSHMEKHLVVQRFIWFKCPFCSFINLEAKRIMSHFQGEHLERLLEIISPETLWDILPAELALNLLKNNPRLDPENPLMKFTNAHEEPCEDGTIVPKIINTRTITSEVFERGAQETDDDLIAGISGSSCDGLSAHFERLQIPKIVEVKSTSKANTLPKILDVRSMADSKSASTNKKNSKLQLRVKQKSADEVPSKANKRTESPGDAASEESLSNTETKSSEDALNGVSGSKVIMVDANKSTSKSNGNTCNNISKFAATTSQSADEHLRDKKSLEDEKMDTSDDMLTDTSSDAQTQKQIENTAYTSISKPPPLARIPQHILQPDKPDKSEVQPAKGGKERLTVSSRNPKTIRQQIRRIALNAPLSSKEKILNFSCHLCGEPINTSWSVISAHYKKKHSEEYKLSIVAPELLRISPEFINGGYKDLLGGRKRKSDSFLSSSKRRRRWTPKKHAETKNTNSPGLGLCVQQETAEDGEGNFKCKKCNQRCTDMADLREHIASNHRIKGRYLICLECGENFVVAPSLQMHLKAFHGIEDPITYMTQNTSYAPDSVDELEIEGKTTEANQCHVCMAVFEDKAAVDKHLRVHGMAFLNRKRIEARNALKSPEKKNEVEEGKQNSDKGSPKEHARRDKPAETILEKINATI